MSERVKWIDRSFEFALPLEVFPCILERLRGTPARLDEMVKSYQPVILTIRADEKWSIQDHIGHLFDLDSLHDARLDDYNAGREILSPADITNRRPWDADHITRRAEDLLSDFRKARMHFVRRLEEMDQLQLARSSIHPRLKKPMRVADFAFFVAEHDDHHLAFLTDLARTITL